MVRTQIICIPLRSAAKAILLPSGEIENPITGADVFSDAAKDPPGGGGS
jgi:hypothetical protein